MEVPQCFFIFCFQMLGFFHCGLYNQVFFINRRMDDGIERYFAKHPIFKVECQS